ncbi:ABC-2 family transporter protein [Micromonospora sp. NPDC049645]|uniref:ABC transporter permease n=1 Tax=Micromonospora sp. NPDC049645 TaxID=3155508 RepID=UPI00343C317E
MNGTRRWADHVRIILICWRATVAAEFQYQANFLAGLTLSIFWMVWAAAGLAVYFQFTGDLLGWTYPELLVVTGLFFTVNGIRQAVLQPNLQQITEYVRLGTLDFLLTKPADTQLLVTLRRLNVGNLLDPGLGLIFIVVGFVLSDAPVGWNLLTFLLLFATSLLALYALMVLLMAMAVHLIGGTELQQIAYGAVELARFPVQLYRDPFQAVLTVVPVVLLTTLPAEALLGRLSPYWLVAGPAITAVSLVVSRLAWLRVLRAYSGASA